MSRTLSTALMALLVAACGGKGGSGDGGTDGDAGESNLPPDIGSPSPHAVAVWDTYVWEIECTDPDDDPLTLSITGDDTCGADLVDNGDGTGTYTFEPGIERASTECTLDVECADPLQSTIVRTGISIQPPADITELTFGEFEPWATPIEDYIEINTADLGHSSFMKDIFDMVVFDHRLYIGYGDANLNLGRTTPIELRYWAEPDPEAITSDFIVEEEQVSRYRSYEDLLVVPGIDATEDDFMGNAYTLPLGGAWTKSRTLDLGWHVHDAIKFGDTLYACGSGGTADDYTNSTVNAFVWRSDDGGETFVIHIQQPHPAPPGDQRFVHLTAVSGGIYVSGYYSDGSVSYALNYQMTGAALADWTGLPAFFVTGSWSLSADASILSGVEIGDPLLQGAVRVTAAGPETIEVLSGMTLIDLEPLGDGRAPVLYVEGNTYPAPEEGPWAFHVALTTDGSDLTDLVTQTTDQRPVSIAFWRRSLYLGMPDGSVWRSQGL